MSHINARGYSSWLDDSDDTSLVTRVAFSSLIHTDGLSPPRHHTAARAVCESTVSEGPLTANWHFLLSLHGVVLQSINNFTVSPGIMLLRSMLN